MPRVRSNINQLREKWATKAVLSTKSFPFGSPHKRNSIEKSLEIDDSCAADGRDEEDLVKIHKVAPTIMDHCLSIHTWLRQHNINLDILDETRNNNYSDSVNVSTRPKPQRLLDDLLHSMEGLESDMKIDIDLLTSRIEKSSEKRNIMPLSEETISGLMDYFVIIGPDATDLMTESLPESQKTTLDPTILFSFPPEQQFAAQCLEHFCFPRGIPFETDRM